MIDIEKYGTECPMCGKPLILGEEMDTLECYDCGPVVFLGGRGADLVGGVAHSEAEDAPSLDETTDAAAREWARLLTAPKESAK